jgi:ubiquinone/menaquinone biosynthesis C-methylase UbiE
VWSGQRAVQLSRGLNELERFAKVPGAAAPAYLDTVAACAAESRALLASSLRLKLASRIAPIRYLANSLVLLGLIGTVIGFIIAFSGVRPEVASDVAAIGPMVSTLISGTSVALYTTLVGSLPRLHRRARHAGNDDGALGHRPGDARPDLPLGPFRDRDEAASRRPGRPPGGRIAERQPTVRDQPLGNAGATGAGPRAAGDAEANRGIHFPRLYDLLLLILTRGRDRAYREDLLDLADVAAGHCVLDVGCGTGTQAIAAWHRAQPGGSVVGVDISEKMLAAARRKARLAGLDIAFHHADMARLPFEDDRFDVVTIATVMHMVPQCRHRLGLREAARVLKRGGRLLLIDYAGDLEDRRHWTAKHGLHRLFDLHSLRDRLSEEGFEKIDGGPLHWLSLHFLRATRK